MLPYAVASSHGPATSERGNCGCHEGQVWAAVHVSEWGCTRRGGRQFWDERPASGRGRPSAREDAQPLTSVKQALTGPETLLSVQSLS